MGALALLRFVRSCWPYLVLLLAIALPSVLAVHFRGQRDDARAEVAAMNTRTKAAAAAIEVATRTMASAAQTITKGKNDALTRLAGDRDALLAELRSRPSRTSAPATVGAAAGEAPVVGTGAALFAEDAEFLVGEAARADRIRISLIACYAQYDLVQQELEALRAGVASTQQ